LDKARNYEDFEPNDITPYDFSEHVLAPSSINYKQLQLTISFA